MVDREAVRWAFQLFLGREPENDAVVASLADNAPTLPALRALFMRSPEFQKKAGLHMPTPGRFEAKVEGAPRILVISNCQGPEIARHLASVTGLPTTGRDVTYFDRTSLAGWMEDAERADIIVSIPLSERFDGIQTHQLRARFGRKLQFMNAPFFDGLFPDTVALGELGRRLDGPMEAHSRLAIRAFLRRESVADCARSFTPETFERFGYFDAWERSRVAFFKREQDVDIRLCDIFFGNVKTLPLLVTANHPTVVFYRMICTQIGRKIGLRFGNLALGTMATAQVYWPNWPVFDFLAEHHRLSYRTAQLFVRDHSAWALPGFIEASFRYYETLEPGVLVEALRAKPSPVYAEFLGEGTMAPEARRVLETP